MEKAKAIVNGIVGDHLDETDNGLAAVMGFYDVSESGGGGGGGGGGDPINLSSILMDYQRTTTNATDTTEETTTLIHLCIFVHGLTDNESVWASTKHCENYGELLAKERQLKGLVICYLRYNTGLHVSTNGRRLAELLDEQLVAQCNTTTTVVQEITFICHSMGGLVARSACLHSWNMNKYCAAEGGGMYGGGDPSAITTTATSGWVHRVGRIIFLGTPHHGSFWEKLGNVASTGMQYTPYLRIASDVANLRSSGIKDLRYGYLQEEDWHGHDPDAFLTNTKCIAEALPWIHYYVASGTITANPNHFLSYWVGDALVRRDSAHGQSTTIGHSLGIPPCNTREFPGVSHMRLTNHRQVYEQIQEWISQPSGRSLFMALTDPQSHQEKAQTITTSPDPNFHPNQSSSCPKNPSILKRSNWSQAKGAMILLETAVDKGSSAIEELQDQITKQVYEVVSTVVPAARTVETIHSKISKGVFNSIRLVNYGVGTIAMVTFAMLEDNAVTRNHVEA